MNGALDDGLSQILENFEEEEKIAALPTYSPILPISSKQPINTAGMSFLEPKLTMQNSHAPEINYHSSRQKGDAVKFSESNRAFSMEE